jgi:anti-sigma B factor antagonist
MWPIAKGEEMKIDVAVKQGVVVLTLKGDLTIGKGDVTLRDQLLKTLADGHRKLLIDVQGVSYVDSAGIGELVRCKTTSTQHGADVKLVHVQAKLRQLLLMTKLIGVFETFDDEASALASFA